MKRLVDVYPYRENQGKVQFLVLKRSADVSYADQWRMVGGKVNDSETYYEGALRELREETSALPKLSWTIPSLNQFYEPKTDSIRQIPAFAAKLPANQSVELNHEHSDYKWISKDQVKNTLSWPEQQRLMLLASSIITNNQILEEWIIEV